MFSEVLFELGTEELPSGSVKQLGEALAYHVAQGLQRRGYPLSEKEMNVFATPRRIGVRFKVITQQPDQLIERQGPAYAAGMNSEGLPTPALLGFARSCGVAIEKLEIKETEKGQWWIFKNQLQGQPTKELIPEVIQEAIDALPIPKPMRWGDGDIRFSRPVHWAVLLMDSSVIEMEVLGCKTHRYSYGHRFHHPQAIEITTPEAYENLLEKAHVIVDFNKRKETIHQLVLHVAQEVEGTPLIDEHLLEEVTSIVEWPVPLCVPFDQTFLNNVPAEALIAAMQVHQKCFPIYQKEKLLPYFITVSNIQSENPHQVITGNERVMRARLSDAAFFYAQDQKTSFTDYVAKTAGVVFQEKLGSLLDKSTRIQQLMQSVAEMLTLENKQVERAAYLSKADLMTSMVNEFPELEGLMGYYYARHALEDEAVAIALKEQYFPRFSGDQLPETPLGKLLSLADRLDTVVGIFSIGAKPTATKDPFKLRRHAVAILRILKAFNTHPPLFLSDLIKRAAQTYSFPIRSEIIQEIQEFILDRLPAVYQDEGIHSQLIMAVRKKQEDCLFDFEQRLLALNTFFQRPEHESLSAACKRVDKLLQTITLEDKNHRVDRAHLEKPIENDLLDKIEQLEFKIEQYLSSSILRTQQEYDEILTDLSTFRSTVDQFFEQVMVMVDDPQIKTNRLHLLVRLQNLFQSVADISMLV